MHPGERMTCDLVLPCTTPFINFGGKVLALFNALLGPSHTPCAERFGN